MKKFISAIMLFVFCFNQAMAFSQNVELDQDDKVIEQLSQQLDKIEPNTLMNNDQRFSVRKFNRLKKREIKTLNKEIKKVSALDPIEQEELYIMKIRKQFKKARKVGKKLIKRKRLLKKISRNTGITSRQLVQNIGTSTSMESEEKAIENLKEISHQYGSYSEYLKEKVSQLKELKYWDYYKYSKGEPLSNKYREPIIEFSENTKICLFIGSMFATGLSMVLIAIGVVALIGGAPITLLLVGIGGLALFTTTMNTLADDVIY